MYKLGATEKSHGKGPCAHNRHSFAMSFKIPLEAHDAKKERKSDASEKKSFPILTMDKKYRKINKYYTGGEQGHNS